MVQQPVESLLARSWRLLNANWRIIVPGLVTGVAAGILIGLLALAGYHGGKNAGSPIGGITALASSAVWVIATIVAIAYTTGMAQAAWQTGTANFEDGRRAFRRDGVRLFVALIALTIIGVIAVLLAIPTLGISLLAYVFFFIYTIPSIIVGRHTPFEAIAESCRIAAENFPTTLLMTIVIGALAFASLLPMTLLSIVPLAGPVLSATLTQIVASFFTLLVVGAYDARRVVA